MNNITIGQYVPGNSWIYRLDPRLKIILTIFWIVLLFLLPLNIYAMLGFFALFFVILVTTRIPLIKMLNGLKPVIFITAFTFVLQIIYTKPTASNPMNLLTTINFSFGLYQLLAIIFIVLVALFTSKYMPLKPLFWILIITLCFAVQSDYILEKINLMDFLEKTNWNKYSLEIYDGGLIRASSIIIRIILMISITSLLTFTTRYQEINQGFAAILTPLKVFKVPVGTFSMMLSLSIRVITTN